MLADEPFAGSSFMIRESRAGSSCVAAASRPTVAQLFRPWSIPVIALLPVLAVGVVSAIVALEQRAPDAAFLFAQQHPSGDRRAAVERIIAAAPEPVPGRRRPAAVRSQCRQTGGGRIGSTRWSCTVRYRSGHVLRYAVKVRGNGSLIGETTNGEVTGCCVPTATD